MRDPARFVPPMLAVTAPAPFDHPDWWFEPKWDGYRVVISLVDELRVFSRRGRDLLARFPGLRAATAVIERPAVLDGELITVDRMSGAVQPFPPRSTGMPLVVVFDCLFSGKGGWHLEEPWRTRRARLQEVVRPGGPLVVTEGVAGGGMAYFYAAAAQGLEGVMAKRMDSPYRPGQRSRAWQKLLALRVDRFRVEAMEVDRAGAYWWRVVDAAGRRRGRVAAPPSWSPRQGLPAWAEVGYRSKSPAGDLRHPILRRWQAGNGHD